MNELQKQAVLHFEGPALILAGAGSGKTRVITHRIAWLIAKHRIKPENILAVTFTNKAATEMKERLHKLLEHELQGLWVTTFHSMGARILRKHYIQLGLEENFSIYGPAEQKTIMKNVLTFLNLDSNQYSPRHMLDKISAWKSACLKPAELFDTEKNKNFAAIYECYQDELRKSNAVDLEDLLFLLSDLFLNHTAVLEFYQQKFQFILVDEYQDTNHVQYELIKSLGMKHSNVCVVGDEDQSIYSWRGADIQNIIDFEKDYGQRVRRFDLNINYRCPQVCLEAANHLIRNNLMRKTDKAALVAAKKGGELLIPWCHANNAADEARHVAREIKRLHQEGVTYGEMVILYRTHNQSRSLEDVFMRENLPYHIFGGPKFFEREEIKDLLAYLSLIYNPFDRAALFRIINKPTRGIGKLSLEKLQAFSDNHQIAPILALSSIDTVNTGTQKKLRDFYELYSSLRGLYESFTGPLEILRQVIERTAYLACLKEKEDGDRRGENVEELLSLVAEYEDSQLSPSLEGFLDKASLVTAIDSFDEDTGQVTMMTMHNAKGLEFAHVFIVGMEEGLLPHQRSIAAAEQEQELGGYLNTIDNKTAIEEERRLLYVGLTRAMEGLYLYSARTRFLYGEERLQIRSRFLKEIGEKFLVRM